jgi:dTDP-D-glucose 4,6-dehydratase
MASELHKKIETPFGFVNFTHHSPYKDCLKIKMSPLQSAKIRVDTYITASNLKNYGLMMAVRKKANAIGPKQKEYQLIEKAINYIIISYGLECFDKNKH